MKKIGAAVCAAALAISMTGCADTSWAIKYDSVTIPIGMYNFFLVNNAYSVSSMASATSGASSDVWSQTVSNTNAVTWAMNSALDNCKQLAVVEKLAADKKVSVSASDKSTVASYTSSTYSQSSGVLSKNGISQTSMERIYDDIYYLRSALFSAYDKAGKFPVSDSSVTSYYAKNYAHVKQIFIALENTKTSVAYTGAKLAAQKKKAQEAYKAAKADPQNFEKYVKLYNEDPGMKKDPNGYIFSESSASSASYDTKFTDLAFSLKVGKVGMSQSTMGYFIEYRVKLDPNKISKSDKSTVQEALKSTKFTDMVTAIVKKAQFQQNNSALDKFSPRKVDLTTSS